MSETAQPVNEAIVALMYDCQNPSEYPRLRHRDGRLFTDAERDLFGDAKLPEVQALMRLLDAEHEAAEEIYQRESRDSERFGELMSRSPKWRAETATVTDALDELGPDDKAEALAIAERLWPDGYVTIQRELPTQEETGLSVAEQAAFERHLVAEEAEPDKVDEWVAEERESGRLGPDVAGEELVEYLVARAGNLVVEAQFGHALRAYANAKGWPLAGPLTADMPDMDTIAKQTRAAYLLATGTVL